MTEILVVAAEASSQLYAQRLLELWKIENRSYKCFGVGSQSMADLGFECIGRSEEMAVVGFVEVIKHYGHLKDVYNKILMRVDQSKPKVALLLDYPGFNLRLAKELKDRGIPVVYYISPQVWAWKKGRIEIIKETVDKMLVVLPFEEKFYKDHQVNVEFVGHPLLDEMKPEWENPGWTEKRRSKFGILPGQVVLGLMPGSRWGEVDRHLEIQVQVARRLMQEFANLKVCILVAPNFSREEIVDRLGDLHSPYIMVKDEPFEMIALADIVLAASGTATLMVGLMEKPMVIMYKMNWLTSQIARRLVKGYFGLVNLIQGKKIVPEIFQEQATVENLTDEVRKILVDESYREKMKQELRELRHNLGDRGATVRVAKALEEYLK